jgi:hypothetical protein
MVGAKIWQGIPPLPAGEKIKATIDDGLLSPDHARLVSIQTSTGKP